jgi:hypothetical protein
MPLAVAAAATRGVGFVHARGAGGALPRFTGRVAEQLSLVAEIWRAAGNRLIIVREFGTLPFTLVAPLVLPLARRILLVNAHNLQRAKDHVAQRAALRLLLWLGFRLAVLETAQGADRVLGLLVRSVVVLPHPGDPAPAVHRPAAALPVVGMVGDFRAEKGMLKQAKVLADAALLLPMDIRFGTASPGAIRSLRGTVIATHDTASYRAFIAACDILVVPYPRESYELRASGVIADATNLGTPVLTTRLPAMACQVLAPETGGICLEPHEISDPTALSRAIAGIAADRDRYAAGARANARARDASVLAGLLGDLVAAKSRSAPSIRRA